MQRLALPTTNPVNSGIPTDLRPLSALEHHREKSTKFLNQFLIDLFNNDQEALKKTYKEISAELATVGYLLRWDDDKARSYSRHIHPPIDAESFELLKTTAYAPMARYFSLCRPDNNLLDDPLARPQILRILDEAEKTGANPDCITSIRNRCPPLELEPGIVRHQQKSLELLNTLLLSILNYEPMAIYEIYQTNENELRAAAYLLGSNDVEAANCAQKSNPPICTIHLQHLNNTAYIPMVQYFDLVQQELENSPYNSGAFINTLTMPKNRSKAGAMLLLAETYGANPEYVSKCGVRLRQFGG